MKPIESMIACITILNLNFSLKIFLLDKKQIQARTNGMFYVRRPLQECFMSGDPYTGAEHTAGVKATQIYYSAWTGTVHMKCWHFGSINLLYACNQNESTPLD